MITVCDSRPLLTVELNMKEGEGLSPELREPTYIDLTLEDDEAVEAEGGELITNGLELEYEDSSLSEPPSEDESTGIKEEERPGPELGEPTYIDLTVEDDEAVGVERGGLIVNDLESESGESLESDSSSDDESNLNDEGMTRHREVLMNSDRGRIVASRKSRQNAGGSLDRIQRV
jgi:hypothetical protein